MSEFVTVAQSEEIQEGNARCVSAGDKELALFRIGDNVYAIENECSHYGAALSDGWTDGSVVTCPWHCWQFDVTNGKCLTVDNYDVASYPVIIEDGQVKVQI